MIEVTVDLKNLKVYARGHAGYAPSGYDIVCAGVSTVLTMLANECEYMEKINKIKINTLVMEPGNAIIDVEAIDYDYARRAFRMAFDTLADIQKSYKQFLFINTSFRKHL